MVGKGPWDRASCSCNSMRICCEGSSKHYKTSPIALGEADRLVGSWDASLLHAGLMARSRHLDLGLVDFRVQGLGGDIQGLRLTVGRFTFQCPRFFVVEVWGSGFLRGVKH